MTDSPEGRIGILADSHGDLEATAEAIRRLQARGARTLFHLGDFCDSLHGDRTAAMVDLLLAHGLLAVRGNNDVQLQRRLSDGRPPVDRDEKRLAAFLRELPVVRSLGDLRFAHSLPFDRFRAFSETIDDGETKRAKRLFAEADFRILFCGHAHRPILFRQQDGFVTREPLHAGVPVAVRPQERYIIIAGAACDGECALYDGAAGSYERLPPGRRLSV